MLRVYRFSAVSLLAFHLCVYETFTSYAESKEHRGLGSSSMLIISMVESGAASTTICEMSREYGRPSAQAAGASDALDVLGWKRKRQFVYTLLYCFC